MRQHERFALPQEWPHWGRDTMDHAHAVFCIARQLALLDLRDWTPTMVHWLGMYDGLEMHLPPEEDPFAAVLQVLTNFVMFSHGSTFNALQRNQRRATIVTVLLDLPFMCWRASWGDQRMNKQRDWKPLEQSWMSFIESGERIEHLWLNKIEKWPNPSVHDHQRFLLPQIGPSPLP
jgi:hypothetical protein